MVDTPSQPVANPLAVNNAPRVLVRTDLNQFNPLSYLSQLNENNQLFNASLNPQTPERSWTQGLARLLTSAVSGYKQAQLNNQIGSYRTGQMSDLASLANYLQNGKQGDFPKVLSSMKNPEDEGLALQFAQALAMRGAEFNNQLLLKKYQSGLDIDKEVAKANASPQAQAQTQLADIDQNIARYQAGIASEKDPQQKAVLTDQLNKLTAMREQMAQQVQLGKGTIPDQTLIAKNKGMEALARGVKPSDLPPDEQFALAGSEVGKNISKLNEGTDKHLTDLSTSIDSTIKLRDEGRRILQIMAEDPTVGGGLGQTTMTNVKGFLNNIAPGLFPNLANQQNYIQALGQTTLSGTGQLRGVGVQRITQNEIQNVVPLLVPTMTNTREGAKVISEYYDYISQPALAAQNAINKVNAYAATHPFYNKAQDIANIEKTLSQQTEQASMRFTNDRLAAQGKQIAVNPNYDPNIGGINKYMVVPIQKSNAPGQPSAAAPGQSPIAPPVVPPVAPHPATPQVPSTQPQVAAPKIPALPAQPTPAVPMPAVPNQAAPNVPMPPVPSTTQPATPDQIAAGMPIAQPGIPSLPPHPLMQPPIGMPNQQQPQVHPLLQLAVNNQNGTQY